MAYGGFVVQRDVSFNVPRRRYLRHHGGERLRQEHAAQAT